MELRNRIKRIIDQHDPEMASTLIAHLIERLIINAKIEENETQIKNELKLLKNENR